MSDILATAKNSEGSQWCQPVKIAQRSHRLPLLLHMCPALSHSYSSNTQTNVKCKPVVKAIFKNNKQRSAASYRTDRSQSAATRWKGPVSRKVLSA